MKRTNLKTKSVFLSLAILGLGLLVITTTYGVEVPNSLSNEYNIANQLNQSDAVVSESFENGWGDWIPDHDDRARVFDILLSSEQAYEGSKSVKMYIDGRWDDGTAWIERKVTTEPNATVPVTVSFWLWSEMRSEFNNWGVVAYAGRQNPEKEEDFRGIGLTDQVAGWKEYSHQVFVQTDNTGEIWLAAGISCVYEIQRSYYVDFVAVDIGPPLFRDITPPTTPGAPKLFSGTNPNNTGTYSISWTASADPESGIKEYQIYRNGLQVATVTSNTYSENNLAQGNYSYYVVAIDNADNLSSPSATSIPIVVDKTSSTITYISDLPDPFRPDRGQVSRISYTLGDNLPASLEVIVSIYTSGNSLVKTLGPYTQGLGANSTTWNGKNNSGVLVANGTYKYRIRATDAAGNYGYSSYYPVTKK